MGIDILIALGAVAFMAMTVPRAVADVVANARASKAGQWDFLDRDRDRRVARGQRWAQAWHGLRQRRHREAGGDGDYRPGAREYFRDLYGGFWQRRIEVAQARRAARPPYVYDPDAPRWHERFNAAVRDKANRVRDSRGFRLLVDPVGERSSNSSDDEWLNDPWEPPISTPKKSQPAGDTTTVIHDDDTYIFRGAKRQENREEEGDNTMTETDATGDVYDVETCKQQCQILDDDLTRVDTSLDVIDEAVRSMADTAEKIGAWLASKNANDTSITGMSTVMEALNPDRIKELMDAVAAAKQGVQDTIDSIAPYEEADQLLAGADGSITNGR